MGRFLLIFLILASTNALATVNKWIDSQGRVHYSDQPPPPAVKAETLRPAPAPEGAGNANGEAGSGGETESSGEAKSSVPEEQKSIAEQEAELKREQMEKQAAADKAAKKQAIENAIKINCDNAQQNLRNLQAGGRISQIGADGERTYMDDTQRQQRIEKVQQYLDTNCK